MSDYQTIVTGVIILVSASTFLLGYTAGIDRKWWP